MIDTATRRHHAELTGVRRRMRREYDGVTRSSGKNVPTQCYGRNARFKRGLLCIALVRCRRHAHPRHFTQSVSICVSRFYEVDRRYRGSLAEDYQQQNVNADLGGFRRRVRRSVERTGGGSANRRVRAPNLLRKELSLLKNAQIVLPLSRWFDAEKRAAAYDWRIGMTAAVSEEANVDHHPLPKSMGAE